MPSSIFRGFPVTSEHEMRSTYLDKSSNRTLRLNLQAKMVAATEQSSIDSKGTYSWESLFRKAYNDDESPISEIVTFKRIRQLLAEYQRSQIFIETPWKGYIEGDNSALSEKAKRGAILFYKEIRGRYLRTGVLTDQYAFRTPSMINVAETAPYGHTGSYESLVDVITHHLSPDKAIEQFDFQNQSFLKLGILMDSSKKWTTLALKNYKKNGYQKSEADLTKQEIDDLVEFIEHQTDPCIKSKRCLKKWVPSDSKKFPDDSILQL